MKPKSKQAKLKSQITNNANFGNIGNLLAQGHDMTGKPKKRHGPLQKNQI
jgi:hypothetical protein